eukprot:g981.t1
MSGGIHGMADQLWKIIDPGGTDALSLADFEAALRRLELGVDLERQLLLKVKEGASEGDTVSCASFRRLLHREATRMRQEEENDEEDEEDDEEDSDDEVEASDGRPKLPAMAFLEAAFQEHDYEKTGALTKSQFAQAVCVFLRAYQQLPDREIEEKVTALWNELTTKPSSSPSSRPPPPLTTVTYQMLVHHLEAENTHPNPSSAPVTPQKARSAASPARHNHTDHVAFHAPSSSPGAHKPPHRRRIVRRRLHSSAKGSDVVNASLVTPTASPQKDKGDNLTGALMTSQGVLTSSGVFDSTKSVGQQNTDPAVVKMREELKAYRGRNLTWLELELTLDLMKVPRLRELPVNLFNQVLQNSVSQWRAGKPLDATMNLSEQHSESHQAERQRSRLLEKKNEALSSKLERMKVLTGEVEDHNIGLEKRIAAMQDQIRKLKEKEKVLVQAAEAAQAAQAGPNRTEQDRRVIDRDRRKKEAARARAQREVEGNTMDDGASGPGPPGKLGQQTDAEREKLLVLQQQIRSLQEELQKKQLENQAQQRQLSRLNSQQRAALHSHDHSLSPDRKAAATPPRSYASVAEGRRLSPTSLATQFSAAASSSPAAAALHSSLPKSPARKRKAHMNLEAEIRALRGFFLATNPGHRLLANTEFGKREALLTDTVLVDLMKAGEGLSRTQTLLSYLAAHSQEYDTVPQIQAALPLAFSLEQGQRTAVKSTLAKPKVPGQFLVPRADLLSEDDVSVLLDTGGCGPATVAHLRGLEAEEKTFCSVEELAAALNLRRQKTRTASQSRISRPASPMSKADTCWDESSSDATTDTGVMARSARSLSGWWSGVVWNQVGTQREAGVAAWKPDQLHSTCEGCLELFSVFRRRHHCRACGRVLCDDCSHRREPVKGWSGKQRICEKCYHNRIAAASYVDNPLSNGGLNGTTSNGEGSHGSSRRGSVASRPGSCSGRAGEGGPAGALRGEDRIDRNSPPSYTNSPHSSPGNDKSDHAFSPETLPPPPRPPSKSTSCFPHLDVRVTVPIAPQASLDLLCNPDWTDAEVYAQYLGPTGSLAAAEKLWHGMGHVIPVEAFHNYYPVTPHCRIDKVTTVHRTLICDYDPCTPFKPPFDVFDSWNSYTDSVNADTALSPDICSHADTSNTDV